jgi:hypothetical protein
MVALAACSPPPPRPDTEGQAQRKVVDAATNAYAACIKKASTSVDANSDVAGNLAYGAMKACTAERKTLVAEVAKFQHINHPQQKPDYVQAVAQASVEAADSDLRQQAVVDIVARQTPNQVAK